MEVAYPAKGAHSTAFDYVRAARGQGGNVGITFWKRSQATVGQQKAEKGVWQLKEGKSEV